jgi:hypothetical protein
MEAFMSLHPPIFGSVEDDPLSADDLLRAITQERLF